MVSKAYVYIEHDEENLKRPVIVSIVFHLIVLILMIWNPRGIFHFRLSDENFLPSVRVDVVDLPDILKKDLDKIDLNQPPGEIPKEADPKPEEAKKEEPVEKIDPFVKTETEVNIKDAQKKAIEKLRDRLKRQQVLEKIRRDTETKVQQGLIVKGNVKSQGSSLTGEQVANANAYGGILTTHMKRRWDLPPWLQQLDLKAVVRVWIGVRGELLKVEFVKRSGNADFDKYVTRTAELSAPFPAPPFEIANYFSSEGVEVGFPE